MDCLGHISQIFLVIINGILMVGGIIAIIRGLVLRAQANQLSQDVVAWAISLDDRVRDVAYMFIVPGCIMFVVSYFGCCGAMCMKKYQLVIYCILLLAAAGVNVYYSYMISKNPTSLFGYLKNNIFTIESDVKLYESNSHLDTFVQVLALLSSVYLLFHIYRAAKAKQAFKRINYDA